jgi:hypothetical protein
VRGLAEQVGTLGDADHRRAARLLLDALSSISREAVGGTAAAQRDIAVEELRKAVEVIFDHGADPAEAARRKAYERLWDLVRNTTDMIDSEPASGDKAGTALLHLAAIPPATVWIPAVNIEFYVDALWRPLADKDIARPGVYPTWVYDPPPEDVDLDAVQEDVWEGLRMAHAGFRRTGGSRLSPRDVTEILTGWLRTVAVTLGDFDVGKRQRGGQTSADQ